MHVEGCVCPCVKVSVWVCIRVYVCMFMHVCADFKVYVCILSFQQQKCVIIKRFRF